MPDSLTLVDIQKLQFSDKSKAEASLLAFLREYEDPSIEQIELNPKPESLNSVNGFVTYSNNERYFFKAHVEESEQLSEYYNASTLAAAGYPVIAARRISHRPGKQIVLYEILSLPTLFDLMKIEEDKEFAGAAASARSLQLLSWQRILDKKVCDVYKGTLEHFSLDQDLAAPIHQLFHHRLAEDGRLGMFYRGKRLQCEATLLEFDCLAKKRWRINGVRYVESLEQIIARSQRLLRPQGGPSIIGHGDAHNGNIFVDDASEQLVMFDPAFAGRHNPLLDLAKPLFHNVFARWMYYPQEVTTEFELEFEILDDEVIVEHSYRPSRMRRELLHSRLKNVVRPTLEQLREKQMLNSNWQEYLRSALFCCPFLTVNLFAEQVADGTSAQRYSLAIKMLGLVMSVEFGATAAEATSELACMIASIFSEQ